MKPPIALTVPFIKVPIVNNIGLAHITKPNKWMRPILERFMISEEHARDIRRPFLDIGASIGEVSAMVKKIDHRRPVVMVEPNPTCVDYLYRLVKARKWTNVYILPYAASTSDGLDTLHFFTDRISADSSASLTSDFNRLKSVETRLVVKMGIRTLIEETNALTGRFPAFIKIDAQGEDYYILPDIMEAWPGVPILCEAMSTMDAAFGDTAFFYGYELTRVSELDVLLEKKK